VNLKNGSRFGTVKHKKPVKHKIKMIGELEAKRIRKRNENTNKK